MNEIVSVSVVVGGTAGGVRECGRDGGTCWSKDGAAWRAAVGVLGEPPRPRTRRLAGT